MVWLFSLNCIAELFKHSAWNPLGRDIERQMSVWQIKRVLLGKKPFINFDYWTMISKSSSFIFFLGVFFFLNLLRKQEKLFSVWKAFHALKIWLQFTAYKRRVVCKRETSVCEKCNRQMIYPSFLIDTICIFCFQLLSFYFYFFILIFFLLPHQMSLL